MIARRAMIAGGAAMVAAALACGQVVLFNDPVQWVTQRSDSLLLKVQVDTAQVGKKEIAFTATLFKAGQKRVLAAKSFKADDVSKEYLLGFAKETLLGGKDFIRYDWSVKGAQDKGDCVPVGIVNIEKVGPCDTIAARRIAGELNEAAFGAASFKNIGSTQIALAWNEREVAIALRRAAGCTDVVSLGFDGKNARSAFLAYSDHFVKYYARNDSVATVHYERQISDNKITYSEKPYQAAPRVVKTAWGVVVGLSWSDLEMLPLTDEKTLMGGRHTGFAAFLLDKGGVPTASLPVKARMDLPGTWGNLLFAVR